MLANYDLKLRGPGAFFDTTQSGFRGINPLWFENSKLLKDATTAAREMVESIDHYPALKTRVEDSANITRLE
jgi:RecG-like helicase